MRVPCIRGPSPAGPTCVAALLHGAACCLTGDCVLCRGAQRALVAAGFEGAEVSRRLLATWYSTLESCPICGFPPPPPSSELPPLPRWVRKLGDRWTSASCLICGEPLAARQRVVDRWQCWMELRAETEGFEFLGFVPAPREFAVGRL